MDWLVERLSEFIKIKSISTNKEGIKEAYLYLLELFKSLNFEVKLLDGGGNPAVFAQYDKGHPKTILFYNHYDVVAPQEEKWNSLPFELRQVGEYLYGCGVADNKGNLFARIGAVKQMNQFPVNVKFLVEGEEEIGSPTLSVIVNRFGELLDADLCIWEDGSKDEFGNIEIYLGCKGIVYCELICESSGSFHSSLGSIIENPTWRMVWALSLLKDFKENIQIDGFGEHIVPITNEDLQQLEKIQFNTQIKSKKFKLLGFTEAELKRRYFFEPTLNINSIIAGDISTGHKTAIPQVCRCKIDFRLVPNQDPNDIILKLRKYLDRHGFNDIKIEYCGGYPAAKTHKLRSPYVDLVVKCAEDVYKKGCVIYPLLPASGPMYLFSNRMPCIGVGISHHNSNVHAPNENIRVDDLFLGREYFKKLIESINSVL